MRRKLSTALFAVALGCSSVASGLGVPYRVADLNPGRSGHADQVGFVGELSGRTIVLTRGGRSDADERRHLQADLWAYELASGGAEPFASIVGSIYQPELLGVVQGRLLFRLGGGSLVWTTDGTRAGTAPISPDFYSPSEDATGWYFRIGDRMLLSDSQGKAWSTDGTPAGTEPLGTSLPWASSYGDPPTLGSRAYFAFGGWVISSDGTAAGTSTLIEFHDGWLEGLAATADRIYFVHPTRQGQELWMSDGSPGGTRRVRRFGRGYGETRIDHPMSLVHGVVFLECPLAGTRCHLAQEGVTGSSSASGASPLTPDRLASGSVMLHRDEKGLVFADGDGQLWRTDGTPGGTAAFGRCAGECRSQEGAPYPIARSGGRSLFYAPAGGGWWQLQVWVTDGTAAGTRPLEAGCARRPGCGTRLAAVNGDIALLELTGTSAQRRRVARLDIPAVRSVPALGEGPAVASGDGFLVAGDLLTRLAADGSVLASMSLPGQRNGDADPRSLIALGDRLVFSACDGERQRIYWTDGTPGGPPGAVVPLADGISRCDISSTLPAPPVSLDGAVIVDTSYSLVRIDTAGHALSILDKGVAAIVPMGDALTLLVPEFECGSDSCLYGHWLTEVFVSPGGSGPASEVATMRIAPAREHLVMGDRLLIADPQTAEGLFAFRPSQTGEGLDPIRCPAAGPICPPGELARLGDAAFLLASSLWRIEGSAGTRIAPPAGASDFYNYSNLAVFDGALYFLAQPRDDARMWLYRSDGSEAGTVALAPVGVFSWGIIDFRPLGLDGKLYFTVATGKPGEGLWVSDGTAAGTHLFLDLHESLASSQPLLLSVAAGRLFFAADDGEHGIELWSTDGTTAHTAMLADIAPGPLSSWPGRLVLAGGTLYFAAEDGSAGRELWAVPVVP